jgi:hypothetical protein
VSESNEDGGYIWGSRAIGREIDRSERQTFYLIERGHLKCVKKVGGIYVAQRGALRREMSAVEQRQDEAVS